MQRYDDRGRLLPTKLPPGGDRGTRCSRTRNQNSVGTSLTHHGCSHVSLKCELDNKSGVGEGGLVVDVAVWAESEEREKWWREIVGIAPSEDRRVARDVGELLCDKNSTASARGESKPTALRGMTAA